VEDDKPITILNRALVWSHGSVKYEADRKHVREILSYFKLDHTSKGLHLPIVKETKKELDEGESELEPRLATEFRGLAARANYLSLDRPDIQFATKEICREMAKPTERGMQKMKRLARYLLQFPRLVLEFNPSLEDGGVIDVYSDSDWAGRLRTRKSTSGGVMMLGNGVMKTWSNTQSTIAQSSGEAECYALVRAAAEGLGMQSIMQDLGWKVRIRLWADSNLFQNWSGKGQTFGSEVSVAPRGCAT